MKLNSRGYLLVEIIVASVLAITLMYFLVEITINLKNINEDYYVETKLETDQILMIRDVMNDISNNTLVSVTTTGNIVDFSFKDSNENEFKTRITIDNNTFKYGKINSSNNYDNSVYINTFDKNLDVKSLTIDNLCYTNNQYKKCNEVDVNTINKGLLQIKIPASTIFDENDYGINLSIPYSYKEVKVKVELPKYLYYGTNYTYRSDVYMDIYRCNEDGSNCKYIKRAAGTINANTASLRPEIGANDNYWYYAGCTYGNSKYINKMEMFLCQDNTCQDTPFKWPTGYINANTNLNIPISIISNNTYMYYSTSHLSTSGLNIPSMDIYRCNIDGTNCQDTPFTSARGFTNNGNGSANGTGNNFPPAMAVNDKYFYYSSSHQSISGNYIADMDLYRCNIDGTNCNTFASASGSSSNDGSELWPIIVADNTNLYYTASLNYTNTMDIYKCNIDGTNCNKINTTAGYIGYSSEGTSLNPVLAINDKYLYYTKTEISTGIYANIISLNRCNRDGTNCIKYKDMLHGYINYGPGIAPNIVANNNYVYFTTAKSNNTGNAYSTTFSLYRCDINLDKCDYVEALEGFANTSGSVMEPNLLLTK